MIAIRGPRRSGRTTTLCMLAKFLAAHKLVIFVGDSVETRRMLRKEMALGDVRLHHHLDSLDSFHGVDAYIIIDNLDFYTHSDRTLRAGISLDIVAYSVETHEPLSPYEVDESNVEEWQNIRFPRNWATL